MLIRKTKVPTPTLRQCTKKYSLSLPLFVFLVAFIPLRQTFHL